MLQSMEMAHAAFVSEAHPFLDHSTVSKRLRKLYKTLVAHNCLSATRLPSIGSSGVIPYCVIQHELPLTAEDKRERMKSIKSLNARSMQLKYMPAEGWGVDVNSLSCACRYHTKHGMCVHVIAAAVEAGVTCPGFSSPPRQFVPNIRRPRRRRGSLQTQGYEQTAVSAPDNRVISGSPATAVSTESMGCRDPSTTLDTDQDDESSSESSDSDNEQETRALAGNIVLASQDTESNTRTCSNVSTVSEEPQPQTTTRSTQPHEALNAVHETTNSDQLRPSGSAAAGHDYQLPPLVQPTVAGTSTAVRQSGRKRRLTAKALESQKQLRTRSRN